MNGKKIKLNGRQVKQVKICESRNIYKLPSSINELLEFLRNKYPALTDEQHYLRMLTALHEAGHIFMGIACNSASNSVGFNDALVCVPGKLIRAPRIKFKGVAGDGYAGVYPTLTVDEVLIALAGPFAESICMSDPSTYWRNTPCCYSEVKEAKEIYDEIDIREHAPSLYHLIHFTACYIDKHMDLIAVVAVALLCMGDRKGVVSTRKIRDIHYQIAQHKDFNRLTRAEIYGESHGPRSPH